MRNEELGVLWQLNSTRGNSKYERFWFAKFLARFEFSRAFLQPVSYGEKRGKIRIVLEIVQINVYFILLSL